VIFRFPDRCEIHHLEDVPAIGQRTDVGGATFAVVSVDRSDDRRAVCVVVPDWDGTRLTSEAAGVPRLPEADSRSAALRVVPDGAWPQASVA
jgi:hypothetical protein